MRGNWNPLPERNQKSNLWLSCAVRGLDFLICEAALTAFASLGCGSDAAEAGVLAVVFALCEDGLGGVCVM